MPGGVTVRPMNNEPTGTAGVAAWRFAPLALIACALLLCWAMGWHRYLSLAWLADSRDTLRADVDAHILLSAFAFVALYVVVTALSFPAASLLTIVAGFLFGWLPGAALAVVGATTGASLLFLAARTAFGGFLRHKAGPLAARFSKGFEEDAFAYLLFLRLAPFVPFFVVNIAPALCGVRPKVFVAATAIGILPGALAYSWLGQGLDSVLDAAKAAGREVSIHDLVTPQMMVAFAALARVALLAAIVGRRLPSRAT